jgi:hypothetical protein
MAKLQIDLLAEQLTERELHSALENLPEDLSQAYGNVMNRISAQNEKQRHLAMTTLKWITYTTEPLKAGALQHALAVIPDFTEINEKDLIDIEQLVSFCVGIVTIDREGGIIRLVHYTIQKYLEKELPRVRANIEIARTCLSYLTLDVFSMPCDNEDSLNERIRKYKLSSYAASHWADHVRGRPEEHLQALVLATFESDGTRDSMLQLRDNPRRSYGFYSSYNSSLLHLASSHGLSNICKTLLSNYKRGWRLINYKRLYLFSLLSAD